MYRPNSKKSKAGFTLLETLLTVAIIAIVSGVVFLAASSISKSLRQTELDSKAQIIYTAAQNRLSELRASGRESVYNGAPEGDGGSGLVALSAGENADADMGLQYVSSSSVTAKTAILPQGAVDFEIWDNTWYIEYNPHSGSVSGVFYTEEPENFNYAEQAGALRASKQARLDAGAKVGFYGGDAVDIEDNSGLALSVSAQNGEVLAAEFTSNVRPASLQYRITDSAGSQTGWINYNGSYTQDGGTFTAKVTLDSLAGNDTRFCNLTFAAGGAARLIPGDITVDVKSTAEVGGKTVKKTASAKMNTLFDRVEGGTAYISCGRHLQNLDKSSGVSGITAARQTDSIGFGDDGGWYEAYGAKLFTPITNPDIQSYTGSLDGSRYIISGLRESASGGAGIFAVFGGSELTDITVTGASITGDDVGALAGKTTGSVTVSGCRVYLTASDADGARATAANAFPASLISGSTAGGLIGTAAGAVSIDGSLAATVISGTSRAGGLVGFMQSGGSVSSSYADCYLTGADTGGLVGGSAGTVTVSGSYSAGFSKASGSAAGLVCGRASMSNSYAAMSYWGGAVSTTAQAGSSSDGQVYFLSTADGVGGGYNAAGTSGKEFAGLGKTGITGFTTDSPSANSHSYNLQKGMALTDYSFPRVQGLPHYGDWQADYVSGIVYFEVYDDGSYGYYGANIINTLSDGKTAVGDGYGLTYPNGAGWGSAKYNNYSFTPGDITAKQVTVGGKTYSVYLFPTKILEQYCDGTRFWQQLTCAGETFYINPYFAKMFSSSGDMGLQKDTAVYIRTARQLRGLSLNYGAYYQSYKDALPSCSFTQEADVDYSNYGWSVYSIVSPSTASVQAPIGTSSAQPFTALYNGGGHTISGVSFNTAGGTCVGLFGYNAGRLVNIALASEYTKGGSGNMYFSIGAGGSSTTVKAGGTRVYMGTLAGFNNGRIYNCAAAGYSADINSYQGTFTYVGGLVGYNYNLGSIRKSSADCPSLYSETNYAETYIGGFAGYNAGVIDSSYGVAAISADLPKTGSAILAGFTAANSGVCSNSYCATALTAAGGSKAYAFSPMSGATANCRYLYAGTYSYAGSLYPYIFDGDTGAGTKVTLAQLTVNNICDTYFHGNTAVGSYPYPTYVTNVDGSRYVHYGDWPAAANLGSYGLFYWEYESGSENSGYHLSYLSADGKADSTLCTAHNDGGVITDYGYGFYRLQNTAVTSTLSGVSTSLTGVDDVKKSFEKQFSGYTFTGYGTIGTGGVEAGKLYVTGTAYNAQATWTLSGGSGNVKYNFNPFYGNSMSFSASAAPGTASDPYEVRSVAQLQFMNWNSSAQKADIDEGGVLTPSYYIYLYGTSQIYWRQSHDVKQADKNDVFIPIGQAGCSFSGSYDGLAYQILNLHISSAGQFVGLFGQIGTSGSLTADIRNITMYSPDASGLVENTYYIDSKRGSVTSQYEPTTGALVGLVWGEGKVTISNCASAGYTVQYNGASASKRYISVGGLVGSLYKATLTGCSAANNVIAITNTRDPNYSSATKSVRAQLGGLVGTSGGSAVINCYSGGSCQKPDRTTYFIAGLVGNNYGNSESSSLTGNMGASTISNSYSYCGVTASNAKSGTYYIAANSYASGNVGNCYYLKYSTAAAQNSDPAAPLTYDQMTDTASGAGLLYKLNHGTVKAAFSTVTTTENGAPVSGKYSFTAGDTQLEGKNYPFPTVLTQTNSFGGTVNVHYGAWPKVGIFTDSDAAVDLIAGPSKNITLDIENISDTGGAVTVDVADGGIAAVTASGSGAERTLNITGKSVGITTATVKYTAGGRTYTADIGITVTAQVNVNSAALGDIYVGGTSGATLSVKDKNGTPLSASWSLTADDGGSVIGYSPYTASAAQSVAVSITGRGQGTAQITAKVTYTKNGADYTGYGYITIAVKSVDAVGFAGISGGAPVYNEAPLIDSAGGLIQYPAAVNKTYASGAPTLYGSGLFLYGTGGLGNLESWDVSAIAVNGSQAYSDNYYVMVGTVSYDSLSGYYYRPVYVTTGQTGSTISVSITLTNGGRSVALTAPYTLPDTAKTFTVTFMSDGVPVKTQGNIAWGQPATPPEVTKSGYRIKNWDADFSKVRTDMVVNAVWELDTVNVIFAPGYTGAQPISRTVTNGDTVALSPTMFSRTGYKITGWVDDGGTSYQANASVAVTRDTTFTARWAPITYTIVFNSNGGSGTMASQTFTYDTPQYLNQNTFVGATYQYWFWTRQYNFDVWNTSANGNGTSYNDGVQIFNLTSADGAVINLYAQWVK